MKTIYFHCPYIDGATVVLQNDALRSLREIAAQKVGVRGGSTTDTGLRNTLADEYIADQAVAFVSYLDAMAFMEAREIAGYFAVEYILMNLFLKSRDHCEYSNFDRVLTLEKQGLALRRGDSEFRLAVDTALSKLSCRIHGTRMLQGLVQCSALSALFLPAPVNP